jgi:hypothetical protein
MVVLVSVRFEVRSRLSAEGCCLVKYFPLFVLCIEISTFMWNSLVFKCTQTGTINPSTPSPSTVSLPPPEAAQHREQDDTLPIHTMAIVRAS